MTLGTTTIHTAGIAITPQDPNAIVWVGYLQACTNFFKGRSLSRFSGLGASQELAQSVDSQSMDSLPDAELWRAPPLLGVSALLPATRDHTAPSPLHSVCVSSADGEFVRVTTTPRLTPEQMQDDIPMHGERKWVGMAASQLSDWMASVSSSAESPSTSTASFPSTLLAGAKCEVWEESQLQNLVRSQDRPVMKSGVAAISASPRLSPLIEAAITEYRPDVPQVPLAFIPQAPLALTETASIKLRESKDQVLVVGDDTAALEVLSRMIAIPGAAGFLVGGAYAPTAEMLRKAMHEKLQACASASYLPSTSLTDAALMALDHLKPNETHRAVAVERVGDDHIRIAITTQRPGAPRQTPYIQDVRRDPDPQVRAQTVMNALHTALTFDAAPVATPPLDLSPPPTPTGSTGLPSSTRPPSPAVSGKAEVPRYCMTQ